MINYSNPLLLKVRRVGQQMGVLRPMVRFFRKLRSTGYEEAFDKSMMRRLSAGDVVWDVGANVGLFTRRFSDVVGSAGKVVAFEPSPATFKTLLDSTSTCDNVQCVNAALSNRSGSFLFGVSEVDNDVTNALVDPVTGKAPAGRETVMIDVFSAADYAAAWPAVAPTAIKIDVEGFEDDVIFGLGPLLGDGRLRYLFVEMHFQELNGRHRNESPTAISKLLIEAGFRLDWSDPSHFIAMRRDVQTSH